MTQRKIYPVPPQVAADAHIDAADYEQLYRKSLEDPEVFWGHQADQFVTWQRKWDKVSQWDFESPRIRWFEGGQLNACFNCLDRHLASRGDQPALIWESDDPSVSQTFTFRQLHEQVCRFANALKSYGIGKGDRVCIYLPMIPEAAIAMLACARIGAVHSVVFGGFSAEALHDRILDADCHLLITAD